MYKKQIAPDLGPNLHTAPKIRKEGLTPRHPPTPPQPPKRGTWLRGAEGVKNEKFIGGSFSLLKMMILQGVGHPVPYLGVSYVNHPPKRGCMVYAPALDLTTLFEVIHSTTVVDLGVPFTNHILSQKTYNLALCPFSRLCRGLGRARYAPARQA